MNKAHAKWASRNMDAPNMVILNEATKLVGEGMLLHEALYQAVTDDAIRFVQSQPESEREDSFGTSLAIRSELSHFYLRRVRDYAISESAQINEFWSRRSGGFAKRRLALLKRFIAACEKAGAAEAKQKAKEAAEKAAARAKARKAEKKAKDKAKASKPKGDPGISLKEIEAFAAKPEPVEKPAEVAIPAAEVIAA